MEAGALLGVFLAASASPVITFIAKILDVIISFVCYREVVDGVTHIRLLDDVIAASGRMQRRHMEAGRLPADGWHFVWIKGPVFVLKTTEITPNVGRRSLCELFIFGSAAYKAVNKLLFLRKAQARIRAAARRTGHRQI